MQDKYDDQFQKISSLKLLLQVIVVPNFYNKLIYLKNIITFADKSPTISSKRQIFLKSLSVNLL